MSDYLEATRASIAAHCERRGIPQPEQASVRRHIADAFGKQLHHMDARMLRRVNQLLPQLLTDYLGGLKRR
jgi:hypothetical protein